MKILCIIGVVACCSGCISSHVAWVGGMEPDVPDSIEARCCFKGGDEISVMASERLNAICRKDGDELPMTIYLERGESKPSNGLLAKVNNVFSFVTLGVWPWVRCQKQDCKVEIVVFGEKIEQEFVLGHRAWSSFVLPIGVIPCPALITDWRSWPTLRLDFQRGPGQEDWEADVISGYVGELLTPEVFEKLRKCRAELRK